MALHHRGALIGVDTPMTHALSGATSHSPSRHRPKPLTLFKPKYTVAQIEQSARIIQANFKRTLYASAQKELSAAKLLFQRVQSTDNSDDHIKERAIMRSKEAYSLSPEEQLARFEEAMKMAQDVRDERQVDEYLKSKAEKALLAPQHALRPKIALSSLHSHARKIQRIRRLNIRRRERDMLAGAALQTLVDSKQLYQRPPSTPRDGDAEQVLIGSPRFSPSGRRSPGLSPGSPRRKNVLAGVRLMPEDRAQVVAEAMQKAAEEDEVRAYAAWKRERALLSTGPRAVPKQSPSALNNAACKLQWHVRHFLAVKRMSDAIAKRHHSTENLFVSKGKPISRAPREAEGGSMPVYEARLDDEDEHAAAATRLQAARRGQQGRREAKQIAEAEQPIGDGAQEAVGGSVAVATTTAQEDAWFDDHVLLLEQRLSAMIQALAEARPHDPLRFMADWLADSCTDSPLPVQDLVAEQEWMSRHGPTLQQAISHLMQAAATTRPSNLLIFLAEEALRAL